MEINEISVLRDKIDLLDDRIIELFAQRMEAVGRIHEIKRESGLPLENAEREREILDRAGRKSPPGLVYYSKSLIASILELSRYYQND